MLRKSRASIPHGVARSNRLVRYYIGKLVAWLVPISLGHQVRVGPIEARPDIETLRSRLERLESVTFANLQLALHATTTLIGEYDNPRSEWTLNHALDIVDKASGSQELSLAKAQLHRAAGLSHYYHARDDFDLEDPQKASTLQTAREHLETAKSVVNDLAASEETEANRKRFAQSVLVKIHMLLAEVLQSIGSIEEEPPDTGPVSDTCEDSRGTISESLQAIRELHCAVLIVRNWEDVSESDVSVGDLYDKIGYTYMRIGKYKEQLTMRRRLHRIFLWGALIRDFTWFWMQPLFSSVKR
jgi:hypothetical protein